MKAKVNALVKGLRELKEDFKSNLPFPHLIFDGYSDETLVMEAEKAFPMTLDRHWTRYLHINEAKYGLSRYALLPVPVQRLVDHFHSEAFVSELSALVGEKLFPDPLLTGGGMQQTFRNGYLNLHTDFSHHPFHSNWQRKVTLILYLNSNWQENFGGHLQLWDKNANRCMASIAPLANRLVIFESGPNALHGYPDRLACPPDCSRKSLAIYYYCLSPKSKPRPTVYHHPSKNPFIQGTVSAENFLLRIYSRLRRGFR